MDLGIEGLTFVELIGRGGFGAVYRVRDEAHGRDLAVKVLPALLDDSARRQFDRERRAMGVLSDDPGIGVVHTSGFTANGEPYIAMELLRGGSLADRIAQGPMPIADALTIGASMADALEAAHQAGVLHLDVKPENILFSHRGTPKLVDFGIAKLADDQRFTATIRATPAYAAPEVLEGSPAAVSADIYSLAVTLYSAIMGRAPYAGDSMLTVLRRIAIEPVPEIDRADVPTELIALLRRAMDKSPEQRPATMAQFAAELRGAQRFVDTTAIPPKAGPNSTVAIATPSGGYSQQTSPPPVTPAVTGGTPLIAPAFGQVSGGFSSPPLPPGSVTGDAAPPGSIAYEPQKKRPTGMLLGALAGVIALVIVVIVVATRGGDEQRRAVTFITESSTTVVDSGATTVTTTESTTATTATATATTAPAVDTTAPSSTTATTTPPTEPTTTPPTTTSTSIPVFTGDETIQGVAWATEVDAGFRPVLESDHFVDGTPQICLTWIANDFTPGASWTINWEADGVPQPAAAGSGTIGSNPSDPYFTCINNFTAGLPNAVFEVTWHINGALALSDSVYVGGGRALLNIDITNSSTSDLCSIALTPTSSEFWGRNRIPEIIVGPADFITVQVVAGQYDLQGLDSAFEEIDEQFGLDLQADGPLFIVDQ